MSKQLLFTRRHNLSRKLLTAASMCLMVLMTIGACSTCLPIVAHAQNQAPIAAVKSDNFPEVTVSVLCPLWNDACVCRKDGAWLLTEDGKPQVIVRVASRHVRPKTETTFFLDIYRDQDFVRNDMAKGIKELIQLSNPPAVFALDRDYFAVVTPGRADADVSALAEKIDDLGALFNQVIDPDNAPYADLKNTALSLLLLRTLEQMPPSDAETRRSLVVISDGTDPQTGRFVDAVIGAAVAKQIPVHTIYAPTTSPGNKGNLERIAIGTSGRYFKTLDEVDWSVLAARQRVCDLSYRSSNADPRSVVVTRLGGDSAVGGREVGLGELGLNVPAPHVEVLGLARDAAAPLVVAADHIDQTSPELVIRWNLAPYPNRRLRCLGYEIQGAVPPITETIEHLSGAAGVVTFTLHLEKLVAGVYPIRAWVEDELSLRNETYSALIVAAPATPTLAPTATPFLSLIPTPAASSTDVDRENGRFAMLYLLTTVLTLFLFAFVAVLYRMMGREQQIGRTPSPPSHSFSMQASAILYRVNSSVDTGVKQVVKLGNQVLNLPGDLYLHGDRSQTRSDNACALRLAAVIKARNKGYELEVVEGEVWVTPRSGHSERIKKLYTLQDRCEIILGNPDSKDCEALRYRYIEIHESNE